MAAILKQTAKAAHSAGVAILSASPIKVGDKLPLGKVKEKGPLGEDAFELSSVPGKIVIVGVPACFSPTCSSQVPGYVQKLQEFKAKGVSGIYVVAVNDFFVTSAWKEKLGATDSEIHFIADDASEFTSALGLLFDATPLLGAPRSKRYTLVVQNGVVEKIAVEDDPTVSTVTAADAILAQL